MTSFGLRYTMNLLFACMTLVFALKAFAVEPTTVNFGAKKQNEEELIQKLRDMFERRANPTAREAVDKFEYIKIHDKLEAQRLTSASYDALVDFYFRSNTRGDTMMNGNLRSLLADHAAEGFVPTSALETILRRTQDGQLTDVVAVALKRNGTLRTASLDSTIHQEFTRIVTNIDRFEILIPELFSLVDPSALRTMPSVREKLFRYVSDTTEKRYAILMRMNPRLIPELSGSFTVPSENDIVDWSSSRIIAANPISSGRTVAVDAAVQRRATEIQQEVRHAVFDGSKDRIRKLFAAPVTVAEARMYEFEVLNALDILMDVDRAAYVAEIQQLALNPNYADRVRLRAIRVMEKTLHADSSLRLTIFQTANLLNGPPNWVVRVVTEAASTRGLSMAETEALRAFLAHPRMLDDGNVRLMLIQLRRYVMQSVPSPTCASPFRAAIP